ncbi:hypothetical protein D3C81_2330740 [compost metagenome]
MQLVEQRLELGVSDFVTFATASLALHLLVDRGLRLDRIERIEQLLELAVGDVLFIGRGRGRNRRLG